MITLRYIPDIAEEITATAEAKLQEGVALSLFFDHGSHEDVLLMLQEKEGNPIKPKKYPLVWMVTPFKELSEKMVYATSDWHFVVAYYTDQNYSMQERRDKVYKPILYPVCQALLNAIKDSPKLVRKFTLDYEKMDLQFGKVDMKGGRLLNDFVDVVDLKIKNVQIKKS